MTPLPENPYRLLAAVADEAVRQEQVRALLDELRFQIGRHGTELPQRHAALAQDPIGVRITLPSLTAFFSYGGSAGLATWVVSDEGEAYLPPTASWVTRTLLSQLLLRLHGDEAEACLASSGDRPLVPRGTWVHPLGWWDEWKSRPVGELTIGDVYADTIYPRIEATLAATRFDRVIDVCGGDGILGQRLVQRFGCELVSMDLNPVAHAAAKARLDHCVLGDSSDPESWRDLAEFDVAVLSGAIQSNVMTGEQALATMENVAKALRPGGLAVVTGWSPCQLQSEHFAGFDVLNYTAPPSARDPNLRQHYVLRRQR